MPDLTLTNDQLVKAVTAFAILKAANREFPAKAMYALHKASGKVADALTPYRTTVGELCERHLAEGESGGVTKHENGNYMMAAGSVCLAEVTAIGAELVTLTGVRQLTLDELGDVKLCAAELDGLDPFLTDHVA